VPHAKVKAGRRAWPDLAWLNTKAGSFKLGKQSSIELLGASCSQQGSEQQADKAYSSPL